MERDKTLNVNNIFVERQNYRVSGPFTINSYLNLNTPPKLKQSQTSNIYIIDWLNHCVQPQIQEPVRHMLKQYLRRVTFRQTRVLQTLVSPLYPLIEGIYR